jgi:hypothetical protein
VASLRLPAQADEHPKPLILCWRLETLIVTSEDCAAPPPHPPDPPSTPTVCTAPPSVDDIPASSPGPLNPPPLPELEPAPELDGAPEVEPLFEPDEPIELEEVPELDPLELDPLPELETLPESEAPASPCGELPAVELLPHAPAVTTKHTRHPVIAQRGRTPVEAASMITPSRRAVARIDEIRHANVGMLERSSGDKQIRSGCRPRTHAQIARVSLTTRRRR